MNFRRTEARHPGIRWALGALEFTLVDAMLIFGIVPAWAVAITIPLADRTITINLGDLPSWIVALVAAGGFWKAWRAEKVGLANAAQLSAQGAKIDGMLADRDKGNVAKGEAKGVATGERIAEALKEGQRQGAETERASVAAANPAPAVAVSNAGVVAGDAPIPVTDKASDRVAAATEKLANAAEAQINLAAKKP